MTICEHPYVLRHATLKTIPIVRWSNEQKKLREISFLELCARSDNPEALYRKGIVSLQCFKYI